MQTYCIDFREEATLKNVNDPSNFTDFGVC